MEASSWVAPPVKVMVMAMVMVMVVVVVVVMVMRWSMMRNETFVPP